MNLPRHNHHMTAEKLAAWMTAGFSHAAETELSVRPDKIPGLHNSYVSINKTRVWLFKTQQELLEFVSTNPAKILSNS